MISVVIPNWNGQDKLRRNLPKVLKTKLVDEVIVVDDASSDQSVKVIEQEFPQVRLIKKPKNDGFSSTVDIGVEAARGDLVFLLNSDASPDENCLEYILPHFENEQVFSIGCNVGGSWTWGDFNKGYFWHYSSKEQLKSAHPTLWSSGGSGVFRKSIWTKLGGLDPLFNPFYEEDTDLGFRATKAGYLNLLEPKAHVEHYKEPGVIETNFSKAEIAKTAQRNQLFLIWKNITTASMLWQHLYYLSLNLVAHPKYWQVFGSALIRLPQVLTKRRRLQKLWVLTDNQIFSQYKRS